MSNELAKLVYICGDQSGVGKTSFSLGILNAALKYYKPEELAYIKPCTQCEDVQLLWKWCESVGIHHEGIGPIVYRSGYTQEVIDGKHGTALDRMKLVEEAVQKLQEGRKLVVVDGVGYAGVGSCVGLSNATVAAKLNAPVLIVGRPGIGNAIDSTVMCVEYLAMHGATTIGAVFNKIPKKVSYHTFDRCMEYVTKFFETYTYTPYNGEKTEVGVFGFIPLMEDEQGNELVDDGSCAISCALKKPSKIQLEMTEEDIIESTRTLKYMRKYINWRGIFASIDKFHE